MSDSGFRIQSLARGLAMLSEVAGSTGDLTAVELSRQVGVSRQTAYHLLHTLRQTGFVEQDASQRYRLGWAIPPIISGYERQMALPAAVVKRLQELRASTQETCCISAWSGDDVVVVRQEPGDHPVRVADIPEGQRGALHARASSKILLARATPEKRDRVIESITLDKFTKRTITDRARLRQEVEDAILAGWAMDDEELAAGLTCIAAGFEHEGTDYALTVLAPTDRLKDNEEAYLSALLRVTETKKEPAHA